MHGVWDTFLCGWVRALSHKPHGILEAMLCHTGGCCECNCSPVLVKGQTVSSRRLGLLLPACFLCLLHRMKFWCCDEAAVNAGEGRSCFLQLVRPDMLGGELCIRLPQRLLLLLRRRRPTAFHCLCGVPCVAMSCPQYHHNLKPVLSCARPTMLAAQCVCVLAAHDDADGLIRSFLDAHM